MARGILKQQLKSHQLIDAIDKAKSKPTKNPSNRKTVEEEKEIIEAAPVTTKVKSNKKSKNQIPKR